MAITPMVRLKMVANRYVLGISVAISIVILDITVAIAIVVHFQVAWHMMV